MNIKPSLHNRDLSVHPAIRISPSSCVKRQQNRWSSIYDGVRELHCFSPLHQIKLNRSTASGSRSDKELDKAWRGSQLASPGDKPTRGKGSWGRPARCPDRSLPGGGSGWRRARCASLGGGSAGAGSGGCPRKCPPGAPGAGRGGGGSAQPLRRWLRMRRARCAPPRSPPAQRGSPAPAAGEAWRPGPGAPARSLCRLRRPPAAGSFLQPCAQPPP